MNGQKERLMVLDMIAEGKITAEEAEELFKAMEVRRKNPPQTPRSLFRLYRIYLICHLFPLPLHQQSLLFQRSDRRLERGQHRPGDSQRCAGTAGPQADRGIRARDAGPGRGTGWPGRMDQPAHPRYHPALCPRAARYGHDIAWM